MAGDGLKHQLQILLVCQQGFAIEGKHQIAAVLDTIQTGRTLPAFAVIA